MTIGQNYIFFKPLGVANFATLRYIIKSQKILTFNYFYRNFLIDIDMKCVLAAFSNQEHNSHNMPIDTHQYIVLDEHTIEWCKNFKYLGSHISQIIYEMIGGK